MGGWAGNGLWTDLSFHAGEAVVDVEGREALGMDVKELGVGWEGAGEEEKEDAKRLSSSFHGCVWVWVGGWVGGGDGVPLQEDVGWGKGIGKGELCGWNDPLPTPQTQYMLNSGAV